MLYEIRIKKAGGQRNEINWMNADDMEEVEERMRNYLVNKLYQENWFYGFEECVKTKYLLKEANEVKYRISLDILKTGEPHLYDVHIQVDDGKPGKKRKGKFFGSL